MAYGKNNARPRPMMCPHCGTYSGNAEKDVAGYGIPPHPTSQFYRCGHCQHPTLWFGTGIITEAWSWDGEQATSLPVSVLEYAVLMKPLKNAIRTPAPLKGPQTKQHPR